MFETVGCYGCGAQRSTFFITAEDDLTGRPGRFTFVRCTECGLVYQSPRLTLEHVKAYYGDGYIAHRRTERWGPLAPIFRWAMDSVDRAKLRLLTRYVDLGPHASVLDVGCGAGTFLAKVRDGYGAAVAGVDFIDLSGRDGFRGVEFHHGLFYDQDVGDERFDAITMWHFLEHDYDPARSLAHARRALKTGGRLVVEVPRLDSLTFRLFGRRWPGLQAPQHTACYDRAALVRIVEQAGFRVVDYLPYGAFPPYFYLFCGLAFVCERRARVESRAGRLRLLRRSAAPAAGAALAEAPELRHAHGRVREARMTGASRPRPARTAVELRTLQLLTVVLLSVGALVLLALAAVTAFQARRWYARGATMLARVMLWLWGITLVVHQRGEWPAGQVVYVSNHSSTLDLFALIALGLPNTRFFLSGFLRWYGPFGAIAMLMGTFFTVPQDQPAGRVRVFRRADRILRRTRESVYLSPEGGRVTSGEIGHFNKGAFHLATSLGAPICPLYFYIPRAIDPGRGNDPLPGRIEVAVLPLVVTRDWTLAGLDANRARVRDLFVRVHAARHGGTGEGRANLVSIVRARAAHEPHARAYTFLRDGEHEAAVLSWADLDRRARAIAAALDERSARGARALLCYPPGLDFIEAFFGCLYAGVVAVPVPLPAFGRSARNGRDRLIAIARDAEAAVALTTSEGRSRWEKDQDLGGDADVEVARADSWLATDALPDDVASRWRPQDVEPEAIALLQYTSGSTAAPKGVVITHGNLFHNLAYAASEARNGDHPVSVSWLPMTHDMGLVEGVLMPAFCGHPAYLMSPAAFLQRPMRWLQAISRYGAVRSGGPNFAYELCVNRATASDCAGLDLSSWREAYNGAEPIRATTLAAFAAAFAPVGFTAVGAAPVLRPCRSDAARDEPPLERRDAPTRVLRRVRLRR